jgi:DNA-directed RNA polymerase specialized sigma subunit
MIHTTDPKKFFQENYDELLKIVLWILNRPVPHDEAHELLHSYYLSVVRNGTLQKYSSQRGASFETYITLNIRCFIYSSLKPTQKSKKTIFLEDLYTLEAPLYDTTIEIDLSRFRQQLSDKEKLVFDLLRRGDKPFEACKILHISNMGVSYFRKKITEKWLLFSHCEQ